MALRTSSNVSHGLFFVGLDDVTVFDIVRCIIAFCAQQCVTVKIFMLCLIVKKKKSQENILFALFVLFAGLYNRLETSVRILHKRLYKLRARRNKWTSCSLYFDMDTCDSVTVYGVVFAFCVLKQQRLWV